MQLFQGCDECGEVKELCVCPSEQHIIKTLATKVMGWSELGSIFYEEAKAFPAFYFSETGVCGVVEKGPDRYIDYVWNPLKNIADAWMVAEKLFIAVIPQAGFPPEDMKFLAVIDNEPIGPKYEVYTGTAPKAICNAALMKIEA